MSDGLHSKKNRSVKAPAVPQSFRPRGACANAAARSQLDRYDGLIFDLVAHLAGKPCARSKKCQLQNRGGKPFPEPRFVGSYMPFSE